MLKVKNIIILLVFATLAIRANAAGNKLVYGEDNRLDLNEVSDQLHRDLAESTVALMRKSDVTLVDLGDSYKIIPKKNYERAQLGWFSRPLCDDVRFKGQPLAGFCSGFLVTEKVIGTAGHCLSNGLKCEDYYYVFGYNIKNIKQNEIIISKKDIYNCGHKIAATLEPGRGTDFGLVELDRVVEDRNPLKVRTENKVDDQAELMVIGHPDGLPAKVAAGAGIIDNSNEKYMVTSLDTFHGNSGSAVFNAKDGTLEGILVRGNVDYAQATDSEGNICAKINVCSEQGCAGSEMKGEDVTRITSIKVLMDLLKKKDSQIKSK